MSIFGKKDYRNIHTLSDLIKGINHAFNAADDIVTDYYFSLLNRFFEYNKDQDCYTPKTIRICIDDEVLEVPLITMTEPREQNLDKVQIEFYVDATGIITPEHCDINDKGKAACSGP